MEPAEKIVEMIRGALNDNNFRAIEFFNQLEMLIEQHKIKFQIMDFEYNNEERLEQATAEKITGLKSRHYEWAASWRDKENEISSSIELRKQLNLHKSDFHLDNKVLYYYYLGTEKNDKQMKEIFIEMIKD